MKYYLLIVGFFVILFNSCTENTTEYTPEIDFKSDKKASQLITADNSFALKFFSEVDALAEEDNYMVSPLSVAIALGMTYNGSDEQTKTAFEETLNLDGFSRHEINKIHGVLIEHLLKVDPKVVFEIANSIWVNQNYTLLREFADTNAYYYDAEINSLDFLNSSSVDIINNWISDQTHEKITEVLDQIPSDAVMYLINAIYFYGSWKYEFDKDESGPMNFNYADGRTGNVEGMKLEGSLPYLSRNKFTAVELPYGNNKFVMDIFIPREDYEVKDILDELSLNNWNEWTEGFREMKMTFQMPKFKYEYKSILNKHLANMGLGIAFGDEAQFPFMVEESQNMLISRVIHKTFIDVNEEGTEAAAVTVVEMETTSIGGGGLNVVVDKPFLYIIREQSSGVLVFMGKVANPEYN